MSVLVDTNILLRTAQTDHPMHKAAEDAVAVLRTQGETLCLVPQNLYEFWVVCTRPAGENGLGLTISAAEAELKRVKTFFKILDDIPVILPEWERRIVSFQVAGKNAHDARLVAAMVVHGVKRILTFNTTDFQRYKDIDAVSPDQVIAAASPSS